MGPIASLITSPMSVYSTVHPGTDQRKHQSSASLAFVRGIHRRPVNSSHKWPVTRKMFLFDDVIMSSGAETGIFREKWANTRPVDALAPCLARSVAATLSTMGKKHVPRGRFMIENEIMLLNFIKWIQRDKYQISVKFCARSFLVKLRIWPPTGRNRTRVEMKTKVICKLQQTNKVLLF